MAKIKTCSRCGQRKPLNAFYKQVGGAHRRRGACKDCYKAAERAAWAKNPRVQARRREIVERWREEGAERFLDRCRGWVYPIARTYGDPSAIP